MASQAQIDANRRNALLSTGPSTVEGKIAVSKNAFKHGLRSEAFLHNEEQPEYYWDVCRKLLAEYQPQTMTEEIFVERIALCQAKLASLEFKEFDFQYDEELLPVIVRRMDSLERSEERAVNLLRKLQQARRAEEANAETQSQPQPQPQPQLQPQPIQEAAPPVAATALPADNPSPTLRYALNPRFLELMALGAKLDTETNPAPDQSAAT